MTDTLLPLIGGLILLVAGGELLVRGSVAAATRMGVSPLVIGLTLVGFGTSTPELVTSVQAALRDAPGIAYGNIVGSNIANVLLIGGLAALLCPILVSASALKRDGAVMLAVALVFTLVVTYATPGRLVGAIFVTALLGYILLAFVQERASPTPGPGHGGVQDKSAALMEADPLLVVPPRDGGPALWLALLTALGGLVLVIFGGRFLVDGAVTLARGLGISETVIGLTIVAVGTSMPELVTSVVAGLRKQSEMAFGNIVGSNIYNILGIGGVTALVSPGAVPESIVAFDSLVMVAVTVLLVIFAATGLRIGRREGCVLILLYAAYLWALWP